MIMSDHFIRLKVPAFYHLSISIRLPRWINRRVAGQTLSSPHENRYGCLGETASPLTVLMCPVKLNLSSPLARSHIFITRSPAPVTNHLFPGSTATLRTQPKCPEMTRTNFQGGWYVGFIVRVVLCRARACESFVDDVKVEGCDVGVRSIWRIMRAVSEEADEKSQFPRMRKK
jgi:hypothetical protein